MGVVPGQSLRQNIHIILTDNFVATHDQEHPPSSQNLHNFGATDDQEHPQSPQNLQWAENVYFQLPWLWSRERDVVP